ncbi:MAG: helix-turn-helix transcriptional regulator [Bacteroidota bacterium]
MNKPNIGKIYTSRTVQKILKKYIAEDQRKLDKRTHIATKINTALEAKGINIKELAARLGKRPSEIKKLLNGKLDFSGEILVKIQSELNIRLAED